MQLFLAPDTHGSWSSHWMGLPERNDITMVVT
jgi:hypothetical protein